MTSKEKKKLDEFIDGITAFVYQDERLLYESLNKLRLRKDNLEDVLQSWNVKSAEQLKNLLDWYVEEGNRNHFNHIWRFLATLSFEKRKALLKQMPEDHDNYLPYKLIHEQMYRIPKGGIIAADLSRYITLSLAGEVAGYMTEKQSEQRILSGLTRLQNAYTSWTEFIIGFSLGEQFVSNNLANDFVKRHKKYLNSLFMSPRSAVQRVDWNMKLPT